MGDFDPCRVQWRTGTKVGRTIYAINPNSNHLDDDPLIGVMDTRALADAAVDAHNEAMTYEEGPTP